MKPTFTWSFVRKGTLTPGGMTLPCDTHGVVASDKGLGAICRGEGDRWVLAFWMPWSKGMEDRQELIRSGDLTIVEVKKAWEINYANACDCGPPPERKPT